MQFLKTPELWPVHVGYFLSLDTVFDVQPRVQPVLTGESHDIGRAIELTSSRGDQDVLGVQEHRPLIDT